MNLVIGVFFNFIAGILMCVWFYRIHLDLKNLFDDYAITPLGSLAKFLIPVYNILGIAKVFNTFADRFEPESGDLSKFGKDVRLLIVPFYACIFGSKIIDTFISPEYITNPENPSLPFLFLFSDILYIGLSFVFLSLTKAMQSAVNQKAKRAIG
jgi:hypothetical protein